MPIRCICLIVALASVMQAAVLPQAQQQSVSSPPRALDFPALEDNFQQEPPDVQGAVGPSHLMVTLNSQIRIQDKEGNEFRTRGLRTFWSGLIDPNCPSAGDTPPCIFDPRVIYDPVDKHWVFVVGTNRNSSRSSLLIATTETEDPLGNWKLCEAVAPEGAWFDRPLLGFNRKWIVITANMFGITDSNDLSKAIPMGSNVYVYDKQQLYSGSCLHVTPFKFVDAASLVPVLTYDFDVPTMYLVELVHDYRNNTNGQSVNSIQISTITGDVGSESLTLNAALATFANSWFFTNPKGTLLAQQKDSTTLIDVGDGRIQSAMFRNGDIWCTHLISPKTPPAHSAIQWEQLGVDGIIRQMGMIDDTSGQTFFMSPSIAVNKNSDVLLGYSKVSASDFASAVYSFRQSGDLPGSMRGEQFIISGQSKYERGDQRWGDYSTTLVDPLNDLNFWTLQEYAGTNDHWGTWWALVQPPPPPTSLESPTPQAPSDKATNQSIFPTLQWSQVSNAAEYRFMIATDASQLPRDPASRTCGNCVLNDTTSATSVIIGVNKLSPGTAYFWEVKAFIPDTLDSAWSPIVQFSTAPAGSTLSITTNGLPDAQRGQTYQSQLQATGGTPPYTWISFPSPPFLGFALSSDGNLTGSTVQTGSFVFTAHVIDSKGVAADKNLQVTVDGSTPIDFALGVSGNSIQSVNAGQTANFIITASDISGPSQSISLSLLSGEPSNSNPSFSPSTISVGSQSILSLTIPATTPAGDFLMIIQGSNGIITHTMQLKLTVTAVNLPNLTKVTISAGSVVQNTVVTGTVSLAFPAPLDMQVSLQSDNSAVANPSQTSVAVPTGSSSANFVVDTFPVSQASTANISASLNGTSLTVPVTVMPNTFPGFSFTIDHIQFVPPGIAGIYNIKTDITQGAAPQTLNFDVLASTLPPGASFSLNPSQITSGQSTVLTINTSGSTPLSHYSPDVCVNNETECTQVLLFVRIPALQFIEFRPNLVVGGQSALTAVSLDTPAPLGGAIVSLSAADKNLQPPSQVTIPAGVQLMTFNTGTSVVDRRTPSSINASYSGASQSAGIALAPPTDDYSITATAASPLVGAGSVITVKVNTKLLSGPTTLLAFEAHDSAFPFGFSFSPAQVDTGQSSVLTIDTTGAPLGDYDFTVTAFGFNNVSRSASFSLTIVQPVAHISGSQNSFVFSPTVVGSPSQMQSVTIMNDGTASTSLALTNSLTDFVIQSHCGSILQPGDRCNVDMTFQPSANGGRSGQLQLNSDSPDSPAAILLNGIGVDFNVGSADGMTSATVTAGQPATYNLMLSSNGFSGMVSLSCAVTPQPLPCSASPVQAQLDSMSSTSFTVTVGTTAPSNAGTVLPRWSDIRRGLTVVVLGLALLSLVLLSRPKKQRLGILGLALAFVFAALMTSCGGTPPPRTPGTHGMFTVTVTASSGSASRTINLILNVN